MRRFILLQVAFAFLFAVSLHAQRAYILHHQSLADSLVLEQVMDLVQTNPDSALTLGLASSTHFFEEGDSLRGIFAFNYATYYAAGYGQHSLAIPLMLEFLNDTTVWRDTISIHYGALLTSIAFAHKIGEQREISRAYYQRGKAIYDALPDSVPIPAPILAEYHQSYGSLIQSMGDIYGGYHHLIRAMNMLKSLDHPYGLAHCYLELAIACDNMGQSRLANDFNIKALEIIREQYPVSFNHVVVSSNQAQRCIDLEDYKGALYWSNYADSVIHALGYKDNLIWVYLSIVANRGVSNRHLGQYQQAREAFELLIETIKECCYGPIIANAYAEMVKLLIEMDELTEAMIFAQKAIEMNPNSYEIFRSMGEIAYRQGDYPNSAKHYSHALMMLADITDTISTGYNFTTEQLVGKTNSYAFASDLARALYMLYKDQNNSQSLKDAYSMVSLADSLFDIHYQTSMAGVYSEKLARDYHTFFELAYRIITEVNNLSPNEAHLEKLIILSSKSKALSLVTQLKLSNHLDISDSLRQRQYEVLLIIRSLENERIALENKGEKVSNDLNEKLFRNRMEALDVSLLMQGSPRQPLTDPFNLAEFKEKLNPKQAVISYQLFDTLLVATLISKHWVEIIESILPAEYESMLNDYYRSLKLAETGQKDAGEHLYNVLIKPFGNNLLSFSHLHIVPEGLLSQIPFEALWLGNGYLIQEYEITYGYIFPSMNWIDRLTLPQSPNFLGVAPVFGGNQLASNHLLRAIDLDEGIEPSGMVDGRNRLIPLPHTSKEVESIANLFASKDYPVSNLVGSTASEERFHEIVSEYVVLHLATHGVSSSRSPESSGLFFSTRDKSKAATHDGFLHFGEFFSLDINAHLVVLSACQSGVGKVLRREGVMSLPRGLLAAGVPNVIASLWKVHDEKTSELMELFYKHLLDGNSYGEALRIAKLECIGRGFLPLDWAGFVLIGG